MPAWEYRTEIAVTWSPGADDFTSAGLTAAALTAIGAEGWELVAAFPVAGQGDGRTAAGTDWVQYVFKRLAEDSFARYRGSSTGG